MIMFDKLEDTLLRYEEVLNELSEPDVLNDQSRYQKLMKEQSDLEPVVENTKSTKAQKKELRIVLRFWTKKPMKR